MLYIICALGGIGLVALDQWVKWWTEAHIPYTVPMGEPLSFIPHVLGLNNARNTGGAWSLLREHTWLLTLVSAAVVLVVLFVLVRRLVRRPFGVVSLSLVLAGAVGNLIDRVRLGYVVDMFQTLFMDFPIFNVADICVVCGGIAFCVYAVFMGETWPKKS